MGWPELATIVIDLLLREGVDLQERLLEMSAHRVQLVSRVTFDQARSWSHSALPVTFFSVQSLSSPCSILSTPCLGPRHLG